MQSRRTQSRKVLRNARRRFRLESRAPPGGFRLASIAPMEISAMGSASPFHRGEQQVQARLRVSDIEAWAKKVVRPELPAEHRVFHAGLPFLVAGARDTEGSA